MAKTCIFGQIFSDPVNNPSYNISNVIKNKKKNTEKWQKRRRTCMYQGRPLDEWKDEGLIPKGTDTREKENCPKEDWEDWQCCCEETVCTRKNGNSLCPWDPSFAQFRPVQNL